MGKGVDELRRILERMQKDLDTTGPNDSAAPNDAPHDRIAPARTPKEVDVKPLASAASSATPTPDRPNSGGFFLSKAPQQIKPVPQSSEPAGISEKTPTPVSYTKEAAAKIASRWSTAEPSAGAVGGFKQTPVGPWERVILLIWAAIALAGILAEDRLVCSLGILGIIWIVLRTSIAAAMNENMPKSSGVDMDDLTLRVTALEKRIAALRTGSGPAISPKLQEDILELKTIVKALFKALEEPNEESEGGDAENN